MRKGEDRTMRTPFLLFSIAFAVGCSTKVEIENRRSTLRETAEAMFEEVEASRINVVVGAGNNGQTGSPTGSVELLLRPAALPHQPSRTTGNSDD